ncbi:LytR family transcriptional regulator [Deinococcus metallilatus]|uniref:LCP family protein required for cell wall assembly n=1 Tax=Deinococcus metallilatus TaxID=1211322 RepID=A0AAJ5F7E7_9DEIO|nr:LCP family protein [Deinococcus metallilatus]MBB5295001.1 LCP family protein required for cell wall assembly [Deinococcus metallilatus]QBY09307.1 LytR family transcriptional regulator [Deinococcus metallilatus]RXJ09312.1 LytR family transcriptional regulator [Deinococcus metallilatus]TLK28834.1 LytR family transcriptional regulator [Deinococcus metallilatus]GMA16934.1 hypothetical protein GCM10025871_32650 [Deinococcus metallilatus]
MRQHRILKTALALVLVTGAGQAASGTPTKPGTATTSSAGQAKPATPPKTTAKPPAKTPAKNTAKTPAKTSAKTPAKPPAKTPAKPAVTRPTAPLPAPHPVSFKNGDPVAILLLGIDRRAQERGRSDTIMVLVLNPRQNRAKLLSIPRDSRVAIPGRKGLDKINHAYAYGGTGLSVKTVSALIGLPIYYHAEVDLAGFVQLVNGLGGVTVSVKQGFKYEGLTYQPGVSRMNGTQALGYTRMRYDDPKGDLGRIERQKSVLEALGKQLHTLRGIAYAPAMLNIALKNVQTNIGAGDAFNLYRNYRPSLKNVERLYLGGKSRKIDNLWYYVLDPQSVKHVSAVLQHEAQGGKR